MNAAALWAELRRREPTLALFALMMALAMLPTLVAWGLDDRLVRDVNVWVKPLKFMAAQPVRGQHGLVRGPAGR